MKQKFLLFIALCFIAVTSAMAQTATAPAGSGTESDPYKIANIENLYWLSQADTAWDAYYEQTADIDASETISWADSSGFSPIGNETINFTGHYNGQGYTIDSLTINRSSTDYVGMFGYTNGATIDSLAILNCNITGSRYTGGLVGYNKSFSIINDCYSTGSVSGLSLYKGGLVGYNYDNSQINNCYSTCSISGGSSYSGGLVSVNDNYSQVNHCFFTGSVSGYTYVGGLVGYNNDNSQVNYCYSSGPIYGHGMYFGGLVGYNKDNSQVNICYSTGTVFGGAYVGGFVGWNYASQINNCYSTGSVSGGDYPTGFSGDYVGGFVGYNYDYAQINNCYSTGSVFGESYVGGMVGFNNSYSTFNNCYYNIETSGQSLGIAYDNNHQTVTGLTTTELKQNSKFVDWDFENIWEITDGTSFPFLRDIAEVFPVILPVSKKLTKVGVLYSDTIQVVIMDNTNVTLELIQSPDGMSLTQDGILKWTPTETGDYEVEIKASDANDLQTTYIYIITVTDFIGQGTASDPFVIASLDDLKKLSETSSLWNKGYYFEQTADIDASDTKNWNDEAGFSPIGYGGINFSGNYNGHGYTIDGLTINRASTITSYVGLFGCANGATIDSLGLTNVDIQAHEYVGSLVGYNKLSSTINNCYSTGSVSGYRYIGGLVGWNTRSCQVNNCYSSNLVSGSTGYVGGLVGYNNGYSQINNSYSTGSVSGGGDYVGGLVGANFKSTVSTSNSTGSVSGSGDCVGGLAGYNYSSTVSNSYFTGTVSGDGDYVGGLVGSNNSSTVSISYSTGLVSGGGDYVGGLIGSNSDSSQVNNSYASNKVLGSSYVGVLVGSNNSSTISDSYYNVEANDQISGIGSDNNGQIATALTTTEMKQSSSFVDWDFENNWEITEGISFPRLRDVVDVPVVLSAFKKITKIDDAYSDTIQVVTMDNANVTLELLQSPDGMSLTQDSILSWIPTDLGEYDIKIKASYANGLQIIYSYTITVINLNGQGTVSEPFEITSLDDLQLLSELSSLWNKTYYFEQTADIDASETSGWNDGKGFSPIGNSTITFNGSYNGAGYSIDGLTINRSSTNYIGLFGYAKSATIDSLGLINADIQGSDYVGCLVGYNNSSSTVSNSYSNGSVSGSGGDIGGLVGYNDNSSKVTNNYSTGTVSGDGDYIGGLVGYNDNTSEVTDCYSTGTVSGGGGYIVGLIGYNDNTSEVTDSYTTGTVSGGDGDNIGGLIGYNDNTSEVTDSYTTGTVSGSGNNIGGLIGSNDNTSGVTNSYTTGTVSGDGDNIGALVGYNNSSEVTNSYTTGTVSGSGNNIGGLVGYNYTYSQVVNSYSISSVLGGSCVGGMVGNNDNNSEVTNSYFTGTVSGSGDNIGGLVGYNENSSKVTNSYSTGSVSGSGDYVGGLVGYNYFGSQVTSSYSTGSVSGSGDNIGGLVGYNYFFSQVTDSYYNIETSGQSLGLGYDDFSQTVTGLSTAQMKDSTSFNGLDFTDTWAIRIGSTYPALSAVSNNAPFAFDDTLKVGVRSDILASDYDYETAQDLLTYKIIRNAEYGSVTDGIYTFNSEASIGDSDTLIYCVGELLASGDTLWGNYATAILTKVENTAPVLISVNDTTTSVS